MTEYSSEETIFVYQNIKRKDYFVGTIQVKESKGKVFMQFEYSNEWLNSEIAYPLSSELPLKKGVFEQNKIFTTFYYGAYVRRLDFYLEYLLLYLKKKNLLIDIEDFDEKDLYEWFKTATNRSQKFGRMSFIIPTMLSYKYQNLLVKNRILYQNDLNRNGAFRFKLDKNGEFIGEFSNYSFPKISEIKKVFDIKNKIEKNEATLDEIEYFHFCVAGLNGRLPKISVVNENGDLCIAKLSNITEKNKKYELLAELLALDLSKKMGIITQDYTVEKFEEDEEILLIKRFDRIGNERIPFIRLSSEIKSKQYMRDDKISKVVITLCKKNAKKNLREIFKRKLFRICVGNLRDFILNVGFLVDEDGACNLAPDFDSAVSYNEEYLSNKVMYKVDVKCSIERLNCLVRNAHFYRLSNKKVKRIIKEFKKVLKDWKKDAINLGFQEEELCKIGIFEKSLDKIKFSKSKH